MNTITADAMFQRNEPARLVDEPQAVDLVIKEVEEFGNVLEAREHEKVSGLTGFLLATLTYCYAVGIYSSEDVESACRRNPRVKSLTHNMDLDCQTIRRFRRRHRAWIETCLARVLSTVGSFRTRQNSLEVFRSFAREKLDLAIMMDTAMAD